MEFELSLDEILSIIAGECNNGCHNETSTVDFFEQYYNRRGFKTVNMNHVRIISKVINYAALRENDADFHFIFTKK